MTIIEQQTNRQLVVSPDEAIAIIANFVQQLGKGEPFTGTCITSSKGWDSANTLTIRVDKRYEDHDGRKTI